MTHPWMTHPCHDASNRTRATHTANGTPLAGRIDHDASTAKHAAARTADVASNPTNTS